MNSITEIERAKFRVQAEYTAAQEKLKKGVDIPSSAQKANDLWLQLKNLECDLENILMIKKLGDLYGI